MKNRLGIYYWKCDRPYAFHSLITSVHERENLALEKSVKKLLTLHFGNSSFTVLPSGSQGNHIAYLVDYKNNRFFLRIENGPEGDNYMEIEARLLDEVRSAGVPTPLIYAVDATRLTYPFAFQLMEYMEYPDLNELFKNQNLNIVDLAGEIGRYIAHYQNIRTNGYGLFDPEKLHKTNSLEGLYNEYMDFFYLNWEKHLDFLGKANFLENNEIINLKSVVSNNDHYLKIDYGCLVHKDMALWNILGTKKEIKAIIDWDDSISGDPADDISLLACFHSGAFINSVLEGYKQIKELPESFLPRFWLHLLRNMIVKSVIRVGAGYFDLKDDFFLIGSGKSGESLKQFTKNRIDLAVLGLRNKIGILDL